MIVGADALGGPAEEYQQMHLSPAISQYTYDFAGDRCTNLDCSARAAEGVGPYA